ncbi:MAG: carotenoid oxygenase family protein [Anaeromicrobium sp.]|jgi:carotenoid cleavage dioxygenase-like enzyme|uniref:carotenoid oxygenase family protein n=1 Tax=Anaeromicrobium sp. TaxID=1929132 RepID=UPI0025FFC6DA|nr:carotenoid oxygenase family protein [Anaeromicrobium sp.]MCT4594066.1 carotenoid oxygenase family protein [Anaeromicrobium sp.]
MKINVEEGFETFTKEIENKFLQVKGTIPKWLSGTLVRNGPSKFHVEKEKYNHLFDGLAMLHKFSFENKKISYTNKFLRGHSFESSLKKGKIVYAEFATIPKFPLGHRIFLNATRHFTDNASVNVTKIGKSHIAMTETPPRLEFDLHTLDTLGPFHYDDKIRGHLTTAHPKFDYHNNQLINYITNFSMKSTYNIYTIKGGSIKRNILSSIPVKRPAYMHSFGMTKNYIILSEFPLFIDPFRLFLTGTPFIDNLFWKPEHGTTFLLIDKNSGKLVGNFKTEPFFAFHHVNAFEEKGNIILDMISYEDPSIIKSMYLDKLRGGNFSIPIPQMKRYCLDLNNNRITSHVLLKNSLEFPRINYRNYSTKSYNYIYGVNPHNSNGFPLRLVKFSINSSSCKYWYKENNLPGEPVFVPRPGSSKEDDGIIFSLVLDTIKQHSYLLILDGISFCEIARAYVPYAIPLGTHGEYFQ